MAVQTERFTFAARLADVQRNGRLAVQVDGNVLALFAVGERVFAVDNRCPHMGFPLQRGSIYDGILTCHWHHARFDLASGGTFDSWADDVRAFPVEVRGNEVWVDLAPRADPIAHQQERLGEGLARDIPLVIGKAAIGLVEGGMAPEEPFRTGLDFGVRHRRDGWGVGLTIHTCLMNLLPHLESEERPRALYHGLSAVARDCDGQPPRFALEPLPTAEVNPATLKRWFRRFVEVRDVEGAERCLVSALRAGADQAQMADMLFAAATDHRYLGVGHVLDFTNKALESLDVAGWDQAEVVLASLAPQYDDATRMEEASSWRQPVDLVSLLDGAFESLPEASAAGRTRRGEWSGFDSLLPVLLGEDPGAIVEALLDALRLGCAEAELAGAVAHAAALRIARFPTSNEYGDWDTALHSFSYANAVHQGLRRVASPELLRGVFDAAMTVYLNRFLNVPPARIPEGAGSGAAPEALLAELPALLDRQQQVDPAGALVARYLGAGGDAGRLMATLGRLLLREDRAFHTIQAVEAAFQHQASLSDPAARREALVAAARYLAAHTPTARAQGQTYRFAQRLQRGEKLFEEAAPVEE